MQSISTVLCPKRSDEVYEKLRAYTVETAVGGEQLSEGALADQFGLSKTPVREALYRLVAEGLVELIPNRGYFVRRVTSEDVRQVLEIREALEGMAARLAAPRMTDDDLQALHARFESLAQLRRTWQEQKAPTAAMQDANSFLHQTILRVARNGRIVESLRQLRALMEHMIRVLAAPKRYDKSYQEHLTIIEALDRRDPDLAEAAMRRHTASLKNDLLQLF